MNPLTDLQRDLAATCYWLAYRTGITVRHPPQVDEQALVSGALMGLMRAAVKFDVTRGFQFSTLACIAARHKAVAELQGELRYASRFVAGTESSDLADLQVKENTSKDVDRAQELTDSLKTLVSDSDWHILKLRYIDGLKLKSVGKRLGISGEAARLRINKALGRGRAALEQAGHDSP